MTTTPSAPAAPLARYAAFKRMGDFVFLSGIIAVDPARSLVVSGYDVIQPEAPARLGQPGAPLRSPVRDVERTGGSLVEPKRWNHRQPNREDD